MLNLYWHGIPLGVRRQFNGDAMQFGTKENKREPGEIIFHPMRMEEYNIPNHFGGPNVAHQLGTRPKYANFLCGACGKSTSGRVICDVIRANDNALVSWCSCSCEKCEPTVLVEKDGAVILQLPAAREFHAEPDWPADLARLYEEASATFSAGAFTAASMACRKVLMACACDKGAAEGGGFSGYVDYITNTVLTYAAAQSAIEKIKDIGNEANHKVAFVNRADAERSMRIVTYMLKAIYSFPAA
jgi:hypothetical protein